MNDRVGDIAAFVFANGAQADEIIFPDEEDEIPGLTENERDAIQRAVPLLRDAWIGILSEIREALWALSDGHNCGPAMRTRKTQTAKLYDNGEFQVPLIPGRATCGVTLATWGASQFHLYAWCWTQVRHRRSADAALAGSGLSFTRNEYGTYVLKLETPREGDRYVDIGKRAAEQLWALARPVGESVLAEVGTTE